MSARHSIAKLAGAVVAAGGLGLAALTAAGPTAVASSDELFLATLEAAGISYESEEAVIEEAYTVCEKVANGESAQALTEEILENSGLETYQAAAFVAVSVVNYCPEYAEDLSY